MQLQQLIDRHWVDYTRQNPSVQKIYNLLTSQGEKVRHDHIAFRTFSDPRVNIDVLEKPFLDAGYREMGTYTFTRKHAFAKHYELPGDEENLRVFISQLQTEELSPFIRQTMAGLVNEIPGESLEPEKLMFLGTPWGPLSYETYQKLRDESEYAAWMYAFGFRVNHFAISINGLGKYDTPEKVNDLLKGRGYIMNQSGGEIKGSRKQLLEQSSIMADHNQVAFREGTHGIPACYYEFTKRYRDEKNRLFNGFITQSADKIFESTNYYEK